MPLRARARHAAMALLLSGLGVPAASASTHTWTGLFERPWSDPANWQDGAVPPSSPDTVLRFGNPGTPVNDLADPFLLNGISLHGPASPHLTIAGGALKLAPDSAGLSPFIIQTNTGTSGHAAITTALILDHATTITNLPPAQPGSSVTLSLNGPITGAGRVVFSGNIFIGSPDNAWTGGTQVVSGRLSVGQYGRLGPGPIVVGSPDPAPGAAPAIFSTTLPGGIGSGQSIRVHRGSFLELPQVTQQRIDAIDPASDGVLWFYTNSALDLSSLPRVRIGYPHHSTSPVGFYNSDLTPADNTYRFGGKALPAVNVFTDDDALMISAPLTDSPAGARSLNIGPSGNARAGMVTISPNTSNSYSGGTVVEAHSPGGLTVLAIDNPPFADRTPLGTGPVAVHGALMFRRNGTLGSLANEIRMQPGGQLYFNNAFLTANRWPDDRALPQLNASEVLVVGQQRYDCCGMPGFVNETVGDIPSRYQSRAVLGRGDTGGAHLTFARLTRVDRGTLLLVAYDPDSFATTHQFRASPAVMQVGNPQGLVTPAILGAENSATGVLSRPTFLRRDGSGLLVPFTTFAPGFVPANMSEVVRLSSSITLVPNESAWHLRIDRSDDSQSPTTLTLVNTLTLGGGGILLDGDISGGGLLNVHGNGVPVEAVIDVRVPSAAINSRLQTFGGLTKTGPGTLRLGKPNFISGGIWINEGDVVMDDAEALRPPAGSAGPQNALSLAPRSTLHLNGHGLTVGRLVGAGTVSNTRADSSVTLTAFVTADSTFEGTLADAPAAGATLSLLKGGPGTLTLAGALNHSGVTAVESGTLALAGGFSTVSPFTTGPSGTLRIDGRHTVGAISGSGATIVRSGASLTTPSIRQSALTLEGGARAAMSSASGSSVVALSIGEGAFLDMGVAPLIVPSGDLTGLTSLLTSGRLGSSSASALKSVGIRANVGTDGGTLHSSFGGLAADGDDVLIALTLKGDADLDFRITPADFFAADRGRALRLGGWANGDFDYSGASANADDFMLLDRSFVAQGQALGAAITPALSAAVPEPAAGLTTLLLSTVIATRRRRAASM